MKPSIVRSLCAAALVFAPALAAAQQTTQPLPNYGDYESLEGLFRVGIQVNNQLNGFQDQQSFEQNKIEGIIDYLDPFELIQRIGAQNTQLASISGVFDVRGAPALAGYAQNSPVLTVRIVNHDGTTLTLEDGASCAFSYNGQTRQASFDQFDADVDEPTSPTAERLVACLGRSFARNSPVDPLVGNPFSLQSSLVRTALDLTNGDSLIEQGDGANSSGDPWIVGASYAGGSAGRFDLSRIDARVARGFRVFEGNRAMLKFDLPFNYTRINGADSFSGQVGLGLEVPVIAQRWSLEPRVGYGIVYSGDAGSIGHIAQASVASRYLIEGLGRGRLIIGNLIGYGQTLGTPSDYDLNPDVQNWSFRNGLAYELPLKLRAGGRLASLRGSYTYTVFAGDKLFNNNFHEVSLSFGLRGREESVRANRDLIRFNLATVQARGFSTYTAGIGFRF